MYKLIIFDLDGTLLDTIDDLANSVNFALQQYNFPIHPIEAFRFMVGNGVNKLLERALPEEQRNADVISMVKQDFIKHYFAHSEEFTKPYQGVSELLKKLSSDGYLLAIASNKVHVATAELAARFFPEINFVKVLGQRDGFPAKPNPAILEEIIATAGISKKDVLYVGDSGVDVVTAINAAVDFAGVLWGFRPRSELEAVGARTFVENTEELHALISRRRKL
jgi:phosphoglycolate phosphatase